MTARYKFRVESVKHFQSDWREVELQTSYDEKLAAEDRAFAKATPSGSMKITITNPNVFGVFVPGEYVYIDVIPVLEG